MRAEHQLRTLYHDHEYEVNGGVEVFVVWEDLLRFFFLKNAISVMIQRGMNGLQIEFV